MYIPYENYFLIGLMDHWCDDINTFHLPMGKMTLILTNIHHILQVPIKGRIIHRVIMNMKDMKDQCY